VPGAVLLKPFGLEDSAADSLTASPVQSNVNSVQRVIAGAFLVCLFLFYSLCLMADDRALSAIRHDDTNSAAGALADADSESLKQYMTTAAEMNASKWVQLLIRKGLSPDMYIKSRYGNSLVEIARNLQHTNILQIALNAGADSGGLNEMMLAIILNDKDKFYRLLKDKPELIGQEDDLKRDAMFEAIMYRRGEMVFALAKKQAGGHRFSTLELAIAGGNTAEVISMLNQNGFDLRRGSGRHPSRPVAAGKSGRPESFRGRRNSARGRCRQVFGRDCSLASGAWRRSRFVSGKHTR